MASSVVFSSCLAHGQSEGTGREVLYRRPAEMELLITPIYDLSQTHDIELGLPAASFCPRVVKALVVTVQRVGHDDDIFSPPRLLTIPPRKDGK